MNEVLSTIRLRVGEQNLSDSCSRHGCRVYMNDMPRCRVIVDSDLAFPAHNVSGGRCDYILFLITPDTDALVVVPMELKSGSVDASEAAEQLQCGADFADRFVSENNGNLRFLPVLFHGRSIHPMQRNTLNRTKIRFRGLEFTIKTERCNRPRNLASTLGLS